MNNRDTTYGKQHRGSQAAYESYFAGMDSSMQQKVALTTAHFPVRGRIADMGSGSGRGTFDLACLYDGLELVGVDVNPVSVERASEKFKRPNLSYIVGDISQMVFPANSLDGILNSSVLHHVTSFNNFAVERVFATLDNQVAQLKPGGVIIVRDFVIPDGPEQVYLDLPFTEGAETGSKQELSTAALFEVFAREWRSSVNPDAPVPFARLESPRNGFVRFQLTLRAATEFVLRKDYRADWDTEVLEEYTYLSQAQFEAAFRSRGLRVVTSRPIWNPWIVRNRFESKFYLSDLNHEQLPYPPTNYLIVGEKVGPDEGVELYEARSTVLATPKFLSVSAYRHKQTNEISELVERPHQTIDILPWIEDEGQILVLAKKDFPRPIVNACADQPRLDAASLSGYITEPISAIVAGLSFKDAVSHILHERAKLAETDLVSISEPYRYYTSPGAINELVTACLVQLRRLPSLDGPFPNYTSFSSAGTVRELDAQQVLRACHVGGMFDARLEINIYRLLDTLKRPRGLWIGAPIKLSEQTFAVETDPDVLSPPRRVAFDPCEPSSEEQFLRIHEGTFHERTQSGDVISEVAFEYVVPERFSFNTVTAIPVVRSRQNTYVALELRDLPAVQSFAGSSSILTVPSWRLPRSLKSQSDLSAFLVDRLRHDFALNSRSVWELGGPYFSTPGVTPEVVYPFVVEVDAARLTSSHLHFVDCDVLNRNLHLLQDAHLLIALNRLRHALGNSATDNAD
ncbi:MAG TPA: class I SAM-dependent methyltransferase [Pyrinomonadaceae bacterium]|nr:class I SAM-dependent methyltransferase [Pyrinomonadaceae bacterium]